MSPDEENLKERLVEDISSYVKKMIQVYVEEEIERIKVHRETNGDLES